LGRTDCNARALTPKDFKHVRAALEHLVALEVLERERKPGRKAKWLFRKAEKLGERVKIVEGGGGRPDS
jgi:pyruvate/2-oxoacid:ferredoxin oxidoreductase alpha subunit